MIRSAVVGLLIGSLMCFSNMYFGLQTGWISMMSLQSSLLGFAIFRPFQHKLEKKFGPKENVFLQTVAVATATMPLAAGFVGIIPALSQLTTEDYPGGPIILPAWKLMLWSLGLSFIGVFFAVPLRKQTIIKEKLKFPSGTATAQMIKLLHDHPDIDDQRRHENHELNTLDPGEIRLGRDTTEFSTCDRVDDTWTLKLKILGYSFSISSVYTLLSYFFPIIYALPIFDWITLNYVNVRSWEWYFNPSPSYIGQGIIMGLPTTLSMLLGCVIGWGILSPVSYYAGWAPGPVSDWKTGSKGWILWISLGVMIAESLVSMAILLFKQLWVIFFKRPEPYLDEAVSESLLDEDENTEGWDGELENEIEDDGVVKEERDLGKEHQVPHSVTIIGLLASIGLCLGTVAIVFGNDVIPIYMTLLAVVVAMFLSILGVRALGESDLNPVSGIGKISQIIFAAVMPHAIVPNLIAGGIAEAGAQQAGDLMQDLKTGHLIGASPKAQFYGQLLGSFVSSFVSTGAYLLYSSVYEIPGTEFPAPTAQVWLDMSRLVNGHPLPPHVTEFVVGFSVLFGVLVLLKETGPRNSWRQYIPQGIAFAIGIYNPPSFTLARVIGGFISYFWDQYCDSPSSNSAFDRWCKPYKTIGRVFIIIVASGFVLGEGTFAIVNMILHSLHVIHY